MISDNGKTFKAASKSLEKLMSHHEVQQHLSGVGIEWLFNVEKAPWWGGLFERMVRSAKRCLKKIIGRAKLNYDELLTAVTEAEMIINSRPLTYISSDDVEAPLTPAHFLMGRRTLSVPDSLLYQGEDDDDDVTVTHEQLNKQMRHLNVVLNQFWKRWQREYLLELREAHRYTSSNSGASAVSIGDIVLVHDDKPRGFWRLARIKNVITGKDGQIRGAILRVSSEKGHSTTLQRPLQRLYPLEIDCYVKEPEGENPCESESPGAETVEPVDATDGNGDGDSTTAERPKKKAAVQARDKIMAWTTHDSEDD